MGRSTCRVSLYRDLIRLTNKVGGLIIIRQYATTQGAIEPIKLVEVVKNIKYNYIAPTLNNIKVTSIEPLALPQYICPNFVEWFIGFFEGDGYLFIDSKLTTIKFRVGIHLHVDDTEVLHIIQKKLGVGVIREKLTKDKNKSLWEVNKIEDIKKIIIPILDSYPLLTIKAINYKYFRQALFLWTENKYKVDTSIYNQTRSV